MKIMTDSPIRFPGLFGDWTITLSSKAINIGNGIYWYGILIALGMLVALWWCMRQRTKYGIREDDLIDGLLWGIPCGIIGARIYYVLFYLSQFKDHEGRFSWSKAIAIWDGGLAIYGGVIAVVIVAIILCRSRHIKLGAMMDLGSLHREEGGAVRRGQDAAVGGVCGFDGVRHRHRRGCGVGAAGKADDLVKLRRVHQGPGGVVNGQKPRFGVCLHGGGQHGLSPGGAAQDHLDRLMQAAAAAQVRHGQQQILAGGHDDLVHQLCFVDGAEGAHQHRCAAQICQQLVLTAHAGGGPGGGDDGRAEGAGLILDPAQLIPKFSHSLTLPAS